MGAKTGIEWAESTWTPIRARVKADAADIARAKGYASLVQIAEKMAGHVGPHCEHAGPGCEHCYSETNNSRCLPTNGTGLPFDRRARDLVDIYMEEHILTQPLHWRKPRNGIFVCSQTDLFGEWVTDEMIDRVFAVMALCPQHSFITLTKRGSRMREYFCGRKPGSLGHEPRIVYWMEKLRSGCEYLFDGIPNFPLENVILGVSGSTQADIDALVPELLQTPAACRLLSLEPQVEDVDIAYPATLYPNGPPMCCSGMDCGCLGLPTEPPLISSFDGNWWVIQGGESGTNARPFDLAWADKIREQCATSGTSYFLKQVGACPMEYSLERAIKGDPVTNIAARKAPWLQGFTKIVTDGGEWFQRHLKLRDPKGGDPGELPERFRVRQMPDVIGRGATR